MQREIAIVCSGYQPEKVELYTGSGEKENYHVCNNHGNQGTFKYCPHCGTKNKVVVREAEEELVDAKDLTNLVENLYYGIESINLKKLPKEWHKGFKKLATLEISAVGYKNPEMMVISDSYSPDISSSMHCSGALYSFIDPENLDKQDIKKGNSIIEKNKKLIEGDLAFLKVWFKNVEVKEVWLTR